MQNFFNPYQPNMYGQPMPQMAQRPMFPEPQQFMPQPVQAPQMQSMLWVKDYNEATNYQIPANSVVPLWDENRPYVYRREADSSGRSVTRIFQLVEVNDIPQTEQEFVTRQEFKALADAVAKLGYQPKFTKEEVPVNE